MTLNYKTMTQKKNCLQLDVAKKIKVKIDKNFRILYINNYFTEISGFKVSEIILKNFETLLYPSMPKLTTDLFSKSINEYSKFFFIFKGKTKDDGCYWSFIKVTQRFNKNNEFAGYLLEGKLLPAAAVQKVEKIFHTLSEIENNAGKEAALNYYNGYLEEKNMDFNEFILDIVEVNVKKAEKYFEIDEDAIAPKKKKRSWF